MFLADLATGLATRTRLPQGPVSARGNVPGPDPVLPHGLSPRSTEV